MYKVILFDLWNTIAKFSNLDVLTDEVKKKLGEDRYRELRKQFVEWHLVNKTLEQFIKDLDKKISIKDEELPIIKRFLASDKFEKYPETEDVLEALNKAGVKLVLVSNSPPTAKEAFNKLNLNQYFEKIVFSCDIGLMKPDRKIFKYAIAGLDIKPKEALMVGDSLDKDVNGAISAGLNAILIDRKRAVEYNNKINNLSQLIEKVK